MRPVRSLISLLPLMMGLAVSVTLTACSTHKKPEPAATAESRPREPLPPLAYPQYRVRSGDTLWAIAMRFDKDYRELARINNLDEKYTIFADQALRLEEEGRKPEPAPAKPEVKPAITSAPPAKTTPKNTPAPAKPSSPVAAKPTVPIAKNAPSVSSSVQALPKNGSLTWGWPASGKLIQRFSSEGVGSKGLDISGTRGDPVKAAADGVVVYAGEGLVGYGRLIIVRHSDDYISAYAHNDRLIAAEGQRVKLGQTIAELGSTGAERDKLHFEIRYKGKPIDPLTQLPAIN